MITHMRHWNRAFILSTVLSLSVLFACCETRYVYEDFPVEFDDPFGQELIIGEAALIPGTNEEQLFAEIQDGDTVYIIHGFQGGTWVHLSIRVTGLSSAGSVFVSLGPAIGEIQYDLKLIRTAEGFLEAYDIPIPVVFAGEELEALYGQDATLEVRFTTSEGEVIAIRDVILGDG
jgi:hypothetical protein